jgi:hypothetical protein
MLSVLMYTFPHTYTRIVHKVWDRTRAIKQLYHSLSTTMLPCLSLLGITCTSPIRDAWIPDPFASVYVNINMRACAHVCATPIHTCKQSRQDSYDAFGHVHAYVKYPCWFQGCHRRMPQILSVQKLARHHRTRTHTNSSPTRLRM